MDMFKGIKIIIQHNDFKIGIGLLNCLTGSFSRRYHLNLGVGSWELGVGSWELGVWEKFRFY